MVIQVWVGFLMHGIGLLHTIHGIVDQYVYKDIIKNVLLPYMEDFFTGDLDFYARL